ncbi:MAG: hypothetical protein OEU26_26530 [Candidatus Tectomicrobia bacterium]|nr:hypothetical protein [Candidatus Tectomicrobia bacterium]
MGILVQREFVVAVDDRNEFERQSREGVWVNMRHNGAQMIAYGTWAFGAPGNVVVTHSVYQDFDHWTATRPWGAFATETARVEETSPIRAIYAGRLRLVQHSRASLITYDPDLSEPTPRYREVGEPLAALPPTFGLQSIVAQTTYQLKPNGEAQFQALSTEAIWPWYTSEGARLMIFGHDPLASSNEVITLLAFRNISDWHRLVRPQGVASEQVTVAWYDREQVIMRQKTKLLMVGTRFGRPV